MIDYEIGYKDGELQRGYALFDGYNNLVAINIEIDGFVVEGTVIFDKKPYEGSSRKEYLAALAAFIATEQAYRHKEVLPEGARAVSAIVDYSMEEVLFMLD